MEETTNQVLIKTLYGLYACGEVDEPETVHAISIDTEKLQEICDNIDEELKTMAKWTIKEISIFTVVKKDIFGYAILCSNCTPGYDQELLKNNLFAVNRLNKQVLFFREEPNLTSIDYQNTYKKFFKDGMSDNIIEFNTFYDEGIMNA
jgi:hypothetical protein